MHTASAFSSGQSASLVIGQSSFTVGSSQTTQTGLNGPSGMAFDSSGNLWVTDRYNNRTLEFVPPFRTGMSASLVLGQSGFASGACATTSSSMCYPTGITFDSSGNLWVADRLNNRVLKFTPPFTSGMSASLVIGQSGFTSSIGLTITTSSSMYHPRGILFDSSGNLWVADGGNNRILKFVPPFTTGMSASLVIGQSGFSSYSTSVSSAGLNSPFYMAFDSAGSMWVSDESNNRTLKFSAPFSNGMSASLVIGQPSFTTSAPTVAQNGFNGPLGTAFDSSGNLWIADQHNSRVLLFSPPFGSGMSASLVLGQSGFTSSSCSTTSSGMCWPSGIVFDSSGNLWVADQDNNRVLMFSGPGTTTTTTTTTTSTSTTTTLALTPTDDSTVDSAFPTSNYGTYTDFWALSYQSSTQSRTAQAWLKFDTSGIPSGATVTSATLTLSLWFTAVNENVAVYGESSNSWSESTITWNNAPLSSVSGSYASSLSVTNSTSSYSFDVTTLVASSVGSSGVSLVLHAPSSQSSNINGFTYFYSKEYGGTHYPKLTIAYFTIPKFPVTMSYSLLGGGAGFSPPVLTYVSGGAQKTATLGTAGTVYNMDSGSTWTVGQTLGGSSSAERWASAQTTSGAVSGSFSQVFAYYHQYAMSFSYSITGAGSPSPPTLSTYQYGSPGTTTVTASPLRYWLDSGSLFSATNPLAGSSASERWYSSSANGTVSASTTVALSYHHQYLLTAVATTTATAWYDEGFQVQLSIPAVFGRVNGTGYRVTSATLDNGAPQNFPLTAGPVPVSFTMNSPHTLVFATVKQYQVSLDTGATQALNSITTPAIQGDSYWYDAGSQVNLALNGVWGRASGTGSRLSSYTVNGGTPTPVSTAGTVSALSINAISSPESVTTTVTKQYQLSTSTGSVASATSPTVSGDTGWYDAGTAVTVNFNNVWNTVPQQSRSVATGYTVDGGALKTVPEAESGTFAVSVAMTAAHTIDVKSVTQYYIAFHFTDASGSKSISPSGLQISVGGQTRDVPGFTVWLDSGSTFTVSKVTYEGVDVKPSALAQYTATGPATINLKNSVYDATVKVSDLLGLAVSGAQVQMTLANGTVISGSTGGDGTFVARQIPLGTFAATVSSLGSTAQVTGNASTSSVTSVAVLFGTTSLAALVVAIAVVVGLAVFMLRRRSRGRLPPPPT